MHTPVLRAERAEDAEAIRAVTYEAFRDMPFADGDEHELVGLLRTAGALAVSLVAELDGRIVGQVTVSPAQSPDGAVGWFALGPVSVSPSHQRAGIGSMLIRAALARLEAVKAGGCMLTGNPAYYVRFGFALAPEHAPMDEPAEFFMVKLMGEALPVGRFAFHPAFRSVV